MRRRSRKASKFDATRRAVFPAACCESPINGKMLPLFWDWIKDGLPGIDELRDTPQVPARTAALCVQQAVSSGDGAVLSDLSRRSWSWVRLAVSVNESTPSAAVWGDGVSWLGLAGDPDPWVRGVTVIQHPSPPAALIHAIDQSSRETAPIPT